MINSVLIAKKLSIGYSAKKPLHSGLNFQLFSGKLTSIIGRNAAGKSTLIKTLTKIIKPLSGEVLIGGKNINEISQQDFAKLVSVVLTERLASENFTVEEIISFGRSPYTGFSGRLSKEDSSVVALVAQDLKISEFLQKPFYELSDGQKQKVMIAKALAQQTEIIILDEPTSFLDFYAKDEIFALLKKIASEKNIAVLVSSHDILSVLKYSDFIWEISQTGIEICDECLIHDKFKI